jgi:hypothetical protein
VQAAYISAYDAARSTLGAAHPLRTGIVFYYSIVHFEIAGSQEAALQIAEMADNEGITAVKSLALDEKEDATEVLNFIATNVRSWGQTGLRHFCFALCRGCGILPSVRSI